MTISRIWKYPLKLTSEPQKIMMPKFAKIRFIHDQKGTPTIWAEIKASEDQEDRWFSIYGTNHPVPTWSHEFQHKYIGSTMSGEFVWHIYELDRRSMGGK